MAFGFGSHFCLGNRLARMELTVMFDRLLDRLPDLALADDGRAAQAGGQLRLRLRDHAGGVHARHGGSSAVRAASHRSCEREPPARASGRS